MIVNISINNLNSEIFSTFVSELINKTLISMIQRPIFKRVALMLFFILCVGTRMQAQFIDIPDANFRAKLKELYPACFGGKGEIQLNSKCPAVTSTISLDVKNFNIEDFSGVEVFISLQTLDCSVNQLTSLPNLPESLRELRCTSNKLARLPNLPKNLQTLLCQSNELTKLPNLPVDLICLACSSNKLTSLPDLPATLEILACGDNELKNLPTLSKSLLRLDCEDNQLASLPNLPASLIYLDCYSNKITILFTLPLNLKRLLCHNNQLTSLPNLPAGLEELNCAYNNLNLADLEKISIEPKIYTASPKK